MLGCPIPRPKLLENIDKMWYAFLAVLHPVLSILQL